MRNGVALLGLTLVGCPGEKADSSPTTTDTGCPPWHHDGDGDGYGQVSWLQRTCDDPGDGWVADGTDCDDEDAAIHPGADEACNAEDDDCDGETDEGYPIETYYRDHDGDGYGDAETSREVCLGTVGWVTDGTDCNDEDAAIHPGAEETCDRQDDDCDGEEDEGLEDTEYYPDRDGDGYGVSEEGLTGCRGRTYDYVTEGGDCRDDDDSIHPGEDEVCTDGLDRDCDGLVDCEDSDCDSTGYCGETVCDDGLDDDDDGYTDCLDDECWGDAACPTTVVSRVLSGDRTGERRDDSARWLEVDCRADCDCSGDDYTAGTGRGRTSFWARQVSGSVRFYDPGATTPRICAWGLSSASFWVKVTRHERRYSTTVVTSSDAVRAGFWVSGSCGTSDSAFLPPLPTLTEPPSSWFDWYVPRWNYWGGGADGGRASGDCASAFYAWSDSYHIGNTLLVGDRYVCTSGGDCDLR